MAGGLQPAGAAEMTIYRSLNLRTSIRQPMSPDGLIYLVGAYHPALETPLRFSTDPTERIPSDLVPGGGLGYGTRHGNAWYYYILMGLRLPDEGPDVTPWTTLELVNTGAGLIDQFAGTTDQLEFEIRMVRMRALDVVEALYEELRLIDASADADKLTLDISQHDFSAEPCPAGRFTASRFPGQHR